MGASYHSSGPAIWRAEAGADKMAADMAKELRPYNIAAVSIWMGPLDTERARSVPCFSPERLAAQAQTRITTITEGWSLRCTASDQRMKLSGHALIGAELERSSRTDVDAHRSSFLPL